MVKKGDVLAVVRSTDVGSRKNDLFEGLVQLWLDERRYKDRQKLFKEGSIPLDTLNQTRRDVLTDQTRLPEPSGRCEPGTSPSARSKPSAKRPSWRTNGEATSRTRTRKNCGPVPS